MIENTKLKTVKNLTMANAILLSIAVVPFIGMIEINYGGFIAVFVIAILILVKQKQLPEQVNKAPNYLAFAGVAITIISYIIMIAMIVKISHDTSTHSQEETIGFAIAFYGIGFVAWCLYLVSMIMYWMNFSKLNAMIIAENQAMYQSMYVNNQEINQPYNPFE